MGDSSASADASVIRSLHHSLHLADQVDLNRTGFRTHQRLRNFVWDGRKQSPLPVDIKMQHVSGDVLALIVGLISKKEAASLATTCKALYANLPNQLRREVYGKQVLLRQSKQFLRCLSGVTALRKFLQKKNEIFSCYPLSESCSS